MAEGDLTQRQLLAQLLRQRRWSLRDLSRTMGVSFRSIDADLYHLKRSYGRALVIEPAECLNCGFVFRDRSRFTAPSRCPKCRCERIQDPLIGLDDATSTRC